MSVDALSWAFRLKLTPVQKLTLLSLADRADGSGRSWASCKDTMARTGLSERGVQTAIKEMAAMGYVEIQQRFAPNGRQRSNMYRVRFVEKWQDAVPPVYLTPEADEIENGEGARIGEDAPNAGVEAPDGGTACGGVPAQPASPFLNRQEGTVTKQESSLRSESRLEAQKPAAQPKERKEDPAFKAFYAAYPRKEAPAAAFKAWQSAVKVAPASVIMAGLAKYSFNLDQFPKFVPYPQKWLNEQRWVVAESVPPKPQPSRGWNNTTSGGF